jgi:hypothetical protein
MSDKKKKKLDEGFVPQKSPKKPNEIEKGYVPPKTPKKPPTKPSSGKK